MVLCRSSCGAHCTKFGPGSTRSCVVFRFVRSGCVRRDMRLTSLIRGRFHRRYGQISQKMRRTKFLMLGTDTVPDVLIRLNFVSAPRRRHCLGARRKDSALTGNVCQTFLSCGERRRVHLANDDHATLPGSSRMASARITRVSDARDRGGGPRGAPHASGLMARTGARHPVIMRDAAGSSRVAFGVRVLASSHPLSGGSGQLGKLGSMSCCGRGKLCGCACKTSSSCGGMLQAHHGAIAPLFGSTFVVTFHGKRGVGVGRTVTGFGGEEGGWGSWVAGRRARCGEDRSEGDEYYNLILAHLQSRLSRKRRRIWTYRLFLYGVPWYGQSNAVRSNVHQ